MNIAPHTIQTLNGQALNLLRTVRIVLKKAKGLRVKITQHAVAGTSFVFVDSNQPQREFYVPARMVPAIFEEN